MTALEARSLGGNSIACWKKLSHCSRIWDASSTGLHAGSGREKLGVASAIAPIPDLVEQGITLDDESDASLVCKLRLVGLVLGPAPEPRSRLY